MKNRLAAGLSEAAALSIYQWLLRVQQRVFDAQRDKQHTYTDFVYFAPRMPRLVARFRFAPHLQGMNLHFRAQREGDMGMRLREACEAVLKNHDLAMVWSADFPCLPASIFEYAAALYPKSVVTAARAGGCAFFSLAAEKYTPSAFGRVRWNTPGAGGDQLRSLRQAGIDVVVRGKVAALEQVKDFTRVIRDLEENNRNEDLVDLRQTVERIPPLNRR